MNAWEHWLTESIDDVSVPFQVWSTKVIRWLGLLSDSRAAKVPDMHKRGERERWGGGRSFLRGKSCPRGIMDCPVTHTFHFCLWMDDPMNRKVIKIDWVRRVCPSLRSHVNKKVVRVKWVPVQDQSDSSSLQSIQPPATHAGSSIINL